ncbi:MAG: ankyrin repeat domain-containing protein [Hydrogenophaga sp.]|nr:ankyrin repeat domain-containing protein [Hydrogenophaga sp.]
MTSAVWADAATDYFRAILRDNESAVIALTLRGLDLNVRNEKGEPGLTVALRQGSLSVADFLLAQLNVDVEARNPQGETALMMAALKGHLPQARRLIARRAEVNRPGWTPLHYAATSDTPASLDMVRLLLEHHAYIDAESPNRSTPLMMAAHYGKPEVVRLLLEEGADPLLRNEQGLTAIDFAQRAQRPEAANLISAAVRARQPAGRW